MPDPRPSTTPLLATRLRHVARALGVIVLGAAMAGVITLGVFALFWITGQDPHASICQMTGPTPNAL